jgi:hypothetical protein
MANLTLKAAKAQKKDEFYTQLSDIENELRYYKEHFKGKVIFCNCDDPYESNFFKYFAMNFNYLGLKKLIATCYASSPVAYTQLSLFEENQSVAPDNDKQPYKIEITEVEDSNGDGAIDLSDVEYLIRNKKNVLTKLEGDGAFNSPECIELLKEADIVVTNPPFSLFREYVALMLEYQKKIILMCRMTALHYKEIFPEIRDDKLWIGYGFNLSVVYKTPYQNTEENNRKFVKNKGYDPDDGYLKVPAICWITNLDINKRHQKLILYKKYNPKDYPKYENFDAIEVGKVLDIPTDYDGYMGVPDTFLNVYNPEEFEIIGLGSGYLGQSIGVGKINPEHKRKMTNHAAAGDLYYMQADNTPKVPYSRIVVRRRK